jgi:Flp pilus assembly protein TadG
MPRTQSRLRERRGTAAVEFALILLILIPMLLGIWEVGRYVNVQQVLCNAAREGARQASTGQRTSAQVRQTVLTYLQRGGLSNLTSLASTASDLPTGNKVLVDVRIYDTSGTELSGLDVSAAEQNYRVTVTATILYRDVKYSPTSAYVSNSTQMNATVSWRCMKDIPLRVNATIPLQ